MLMAIAFKAFAFGASDGVVQKHWSCNSHQYQNNMTMVSVVQIDGVEQQSEYLEIGAFCGTECRGSEMLLYYAAVNRYLAFLTVYGENNDEITFKLYDHDYEEELDLELHQEVFFEPNAIMGNPSQPYVLEFTYDYTMLEITASVMPDNSGYIDGTGTYRYGTTCTLWAYPEYDYRFLYWMKDGEQVSTSSEYSFVVKEEANYVAYFVPNSIDLYWSFNTHQYENTMTMVGIVQLDGEEQRNMYLELGAFCGSECRGSTMLQYIPSLDRFLAFLTVYGNDGNTINFRLFDHYNWYQLDKMTRPFSFTTDTICGNPGNPYIFNFTSYLTIQVNSSSSSAGSVSGGGDYLPGDYCTVNATPNDGYMFMYWTENDEVVSTEAEYSFYVEDSRILTAVFCQILPELHVVSMSHSNLVAGQTATVTWTVRNDGTIGTGSSTWTDWIWLSAENRVSSGESGTYLLGSYSNFAALEVDESYTQTQTVTIPESINGPYYLFVLTDAYDATTIYWENDQMELPYNPPPFIGARGSRYNNVYEISEYMNGRYYHDNFFIEEVNVALPPLPDLQVTSIIAPDNFYSGTQVRVTATISNLGEAPTSVSSWYDALYVSSSDVFDENSQCIAVVYHDGFLSDGDSYTQTLDGYVPLTMYGSAYFYVETDYYGQVYEHVMSNNNVGRSDEVNVILTPPADLVPYLDNYTQIASTGANFSFSFTVVNEGAGNPDSYYWYDNVYLSTNPDEIGENAYLLESRYHYGYLQPNEEYTVQWTGTLPNNIQAGTYYLYEYTDADEQVFEYLFNDNNIVRSGPITVGIPDLQVMQLNVPDTLVACYPMNVNYVVKNVGDGAVENWNVTDRIGLSTNVNMTNPITVSNRETSLTIQPGEAITVNVNTALPNVQEGTYHLFVTADANNNLREPNENNNTLRKYPVFVEHQPLPDLQPLNLALPETINAGNEISIEFDVTNLGELDLLDVNCNIVLYAYNGNDSILCDVQSQSLPLGWPNVSILVGETVHFVRTVMVTSWVTSQYNNFKLIVDPSNQIVESNKTNNTISQNANVINCPLPDLDIDGVMVFSDLQAGTTNTFTIHVMNYGDAALENATVKFALKAYQDDDNTMVCPVQTPPFENVNMEINEGRDFPVVAFVPPTLTSDYSRFELVLDPEGAIHEASGGGNDVTFWGELANYPFDLELVSMDMPTEILAGREYTMSWTVKNIGTCPSENLPMYVNRNGQYVAVNGDYLPVAWADVVYVSDDAVVDEGDNQLLSVNRGVVLNPDDSYTVTQTFVMPFAMSGNKQILCVADANTKTYDNNRNNNMAVQSVHVGYGPLPDLRVTAVDVQEVLESSISYRIHYSVANEGTEATLVNAWTDAFYLNNNATSIQGGYRLGSKIHHGVLAAGESYTDSIDLNIPSWLQGDYYFLSYTDATSLVFEDENESNNIMGTPVTLVTPLPCDLMVSNLVFPEEAQSGSEIEISWQISNIGAHAASGNVKDAIYLSTDNEWSSDDYMLGSTEGYVNIPVNGNQARQLSVRLQGVTEGEYYVIVRTNIQHVMNEVTYENNVISSLTAMSVTYPLLAIGSSVNQTMTNDQYIYYCIDVNDAYENQTLSCRLSTPSTFVLNKLYLSFESVPTMASFDFGVSTPYEQELEIMVPKLNKGRYYLLATGSESSGAAQNVTIAASIVNFEILHVNTDHGSNAGSVTTQIIGAKFDSIMDFRLVQGTQYVPAEKVFFTNSTESYATFNLVDLAAGDYGMAAELPGGIVTVKDQAFVVEEGLPAELSINIVSPSSVRSGSKFTINIEYGNYGSTDLNVSGLVVTCNYPIAFQSDGLSDNQYEVTFMTGTDQGNPDVIRPGHYGTRTIFVNARSIGEIKVRVYAIRRMY